MSLISDALKKAQRERERLQAGIEETPPVFDAPTPKNRLRPRIIFFSFLAAAAVAAVVIVMTLGNREAIRLKNSFAPHTPTTTSTSTHTAKTVDSNQDKNTAPGETAGKPTGYDTGEPEQEEKQVQNQTPSLPASPSTGTPQQTETPGSPTPAKKRQENIPGTELENKSVAEPGDKPIAEPGNIPAAEPKNRTAAKPGTPTKTGDTQVSIAKNTPKTQKPSPAETLENIMDEGDRLMEERRFLDAVEKYKTALNTKKTPESYLKIYGALTAAKNTVLARAYVDDGLVYFPSDFYLNKISAIFSIRAREFQKALPTIKKAIQADSSDYTLFTYAGLCFFHTADYPQALAHFQKSLDLNSDAVENYYYMGLIYDNQKEYRKAVEYYNVFIKLNPDNANFKHREWITGRMTILNEYINQNEDKK